MTPLWTLPVNSKFSCEPGFEGGTAMPTYDFLCKKCKKTFTVNIPFRDYDRGNVKCPGCGSQSLKQQITSFMTKTSRKS